MPNINRIRVNNVNYNFGTQGYDDFSMRMYGKNTLYDLANGGGKSILMLLLLQNLIPNCTLDEKQPIEKLFRTGGGNTTIHSLVEWRLDDKDVREGFRYMTTGFCARKAKEAEESNGADEETGTDSAAVEYFNYCIFYRDYNENDIVNLPLQTNRERITFAGLKNYLKELRRSNLKLKVQIFERKGEYQRFISGYGLYESQWEIIRGINKTEGHVRTYFETHYKTTRKVVEDLLIEEILEKAFLVKTGQGDVNEDMAKTLMEIRDKLVELSKKKSQISNYDREIELMQLLESRVASFLAIYEERDQVASTLANLYLTGESLSRQGDETLDRLEKQREEQQQKLHKERRRLEALKICRDQRNLESLRQSLDVLKRHVGKAQEELSAAQEEMKLKESVNDYLRYLKDEAMMEEHQAVIRAFQNDNADYLGLLHRYAYAKKQMDEQKLAGIRSQLAHYEAELTGITEQTESLQRVCEEGRISQAVAESRREHFEQEYDRMMKEIGSVRNRISVMVLSDLKDVQKQLSEETERLQRELEDTRQAYVEDIRNVNARERELERTEESVRQAKEQLRQTESQYEAYRENYDRLKKMVEIYKVKDPEQLYGTVKERAFGQKLKTVSLRTRAESAKRHLKQVEEGRMLEESPEIAKVKEYLESRHGEYAVSGVDYLSALPPVNREDLLSRFPLLPYGLVVKQFDTIVEDERIRTLDLGNQAVPVFDRDTLRSPYAPEETEGMLLLAKDPKVFVEEEALNQEKKRLLAELQDLEEELSRSEELERAYEEDLDYAVALTDKRLLHAEQELPALKEALLEYQRRQEQLKEELNRLSKGRDQRQETVRCLQTELQQKQQERLQLAGIETKSELADEAGRQRDHFRAEAERIRLDTEQYEEQLRQCKLRGEELSHQISYLQGQINEVLKEWDTLYSPYYVEGSFAPVGGTEEELRAEFIAAKAVVEEATVTLEDKQKLIETLQESMARGMRLIEKRGVPMEKLLMLRREGKLHPNDEEYMNRLDMHLSRLEVRLSQLKEDYKNKEREASRLEGRIEQAVQAVKERFGSYEQVNVTAEEAAQALAEGERILSGLSKELAAFEKNMKQYEKDLGVIRELYKDIRRIVERSEISMDGAVLLEKEEHALRQMFEASLLAYDKSTKTLGRARQELLNFKTQTAGLLFTMGAYELSESVKDDVAVPETYAEAKALLGSLREMISYIALEKERVEQGIADMEAVKQHFENQCIQRCRDVKTELEKLPKLSRIQLEGEMIQMVNLSIPYVKDELVGQRMSDYIDEVVKGAERYEDPNERIRFMKNRLLLKKLFGVLVTDMNAIRLKLYKRERMKEQSRYLRYEEAVGSTGQSQGIYIQFLVSVINYIAGMYAPEAETTDLKKVIFIDNPFGAAKDVYIWEPIFAMLKTNNVQLIVPARGATPAITNRFDVNYVLGQQLVGGRQQTVVVDYRSQVEQEELEYQELEYTQRTFDFI